MGQILWAVRTGRTRNAISTIGSQSDGSQPAQLVSCAQPNPMKRASILNRRMAIAWLASLPLAPTLFKHTINLSRWMTIVRYLLVTLGSKSRGPCALCRLDRTCEPLDLNPTIPATLNRNRWISIGRSRLIGPIGPSTGQDQSQPSILDLVATIAWEHLKPPSVPV